MDRSGVRRGAAGVCRLEATSSSMSVKPARAMGVVSVVHQPLPDPTRVAAAVKNGEHDRCLIGDMVVDGKGKPFGEQTMKSEGYRMDPREVGQRVNV